MIVWYTDVLDHKLPLQFEFLGLSRRLLCHMIISLGGSFGYPVLPGSKLRTGLAGPLFCGTEYPLLTVPILKDWVPIINVSVEPVLGGRPRTKPALKIEA